MEPIKITAHLSTKLAVSDDWSPAMDALLIKLLLAERGLDSSNPTIEDVKKQASFVDEHIPIGKGMLKGEWYWQTSSPCYIYDLTSIETINKRWDQQDRNLNWQGKRRNWSTSEGTTKSWTVSIQERSTPRIDWYCLGNIAAIERLLSQCYSLGKKRRTLVDLWEVQPSDSDMHLWDNGRLMRPMPVHLIDTPPASFAIRDWAWRPPATLQENKARCLMPVDLVKQVESIYQWEERRG